MALLACLKLALDALRREGCRTVYIDGSFVTSKQEPGDFDACWDMTGVDFDALERDEPALLDWRDRRAAQKARLGGELFIAHTTADDTGATFLDFFQQDRDSGAAKGIVVLNLGELP